MAVAIMASMTSLAFAQETEITQTEESFWIGIGLDSGAAAAAGGSGAIAGIILSGVRAVGLRMKDGKTTIDPKKLGLNIIVGIAVGFGMVALGSPLEATLGGQFLALYIVNQFRPLLDKWIKGLKQKEPETKAEVQAEIKELEEKASKLE